ncbi:MAG: MarR family transcriptional regulator [Anaerolineaceae bacterium]|jgi:DNA-binding MarR family transcriptional regulator
MSSKQLSDAVREWSEVFMRRSGHDFKRFMDDTGLSFTQINILMRLLHGEICSISDIGGQLGVTNAAASQTVDQMVQMGLIKRTEDPNDRRAKQLTLTPKGRTLLEKGIKARGEWIESVTDALSLEQQNMIILAITLLTEAANKITD